MNVEGIGDRIKLVRDSDSLPVFAEKLGISKSTLVRYESEKSFPDAKLLLGICNLRSINPNWLLSGEGPQGRLDPSFGYSAAHNKLRELIKSYSAQFVNRLSSAEYLEKIPVPEKKNTKLENLKSMTLWGFSKAREVTYSYLRGEYLPSDAELWTMCKIAKFGNFNDLRSGKEFGIEIPNEENVKIGSCQRVVIDTGLLKKIIEIVEEIQKEHDASLNSEKKSEIVSILYEEFIEGVVPVSRLPERAHRLYKVAI